MKLIIGLGNPGEKYTITRHNLGFLYLDYFRQKEGFSTFKFESKLKAEISIGTYLGEKTLLVKPQTFMNLSGESIQKIIQFYKVEMNDWIVIHDDMSMDFGKTRFREKGRAGGHNGLKDIIRLYTDNFKRVKVGIGRDDRYEVSDWVLSKFQEEDLNDLENEVFPVISQIVENKL